MHTVIWTSYFLGFSVRVQELCESRGGRPGRPVPNKPTVSVDVKQNFNISILASLPSPSVRG